MASLFANNTNNMNTKELTIKYRRLDTIKPLPGNAKNHDLKGIMSSIQEFGFLDPILISVESDHDLDGNGRLEALKMMYAEGGAAPGNIIVRQERTDDSAKKVPVWYAPTMDAVFDLETEPIVAMRLNRSHDKGGYNEAKVFAVLEQAAAFGRLEQTGYDQGIFEVLALKYAPAPEFEAPEGQGGNGSGDYGGNGSSGNALPGVRPTMEPNTQQYPAQPLAPSYVRMVQLFMNADTQPVFLERCQRLIQDGKILRDDGQPVDNLTDLIFSLVRDADLTSKENNA